MLRLIVLFSTLLMGLSPYPVNDARPEFSHDLGHHHDLRSSS